MEIALRPWTDADLPLLRGLLGDPAMMTYLGGPEPEEKLLARHARYLGLDATGSGRVFVVTIGPEATPAGWVGYWEEAWHAEPTWEMGWNVLPAFQGRGLASAGAALALEQAAADGRYRFVYAFPSVDNAASNAVCARLEFERLGTENLEYPPGTWMECAIWRRDLTATPVRADPVTERQTPRHWYDRRTARCTGRWALPRSSEAPRD